jgi:hypothetical protein
VYHGTERLHHRKDCIDASTAACLLRLEYNIARARATNHLAMCTNLLTAINADTARNSMSTTDSQSIP